MIVQGANLTDLCLMTCVVVRQVLLPAPPDRQTPTSCECILLHNPVFSFNLFVLAVCVRSAAFTIVQRGAATLPMP